MENTAPVAPDVPARTAPSLPDPRETALVVVRAHWEDREWLAAFVGCLSRENGGLGAAGLGLLRARQDADSPSLAEDVA